jgi:hypothetical protein
MEFVVRLRFRNIRSILAVRHGRITRKQLHGLTFSTATTGSSLNHLWRELERLDMKNEFGRLNIN